jgi:ATP-dependent DNA ligase
MFESCAPLTKVDRVIGKVCNNMGEYEEWCNKLASKGFEAVIAKRNSSIYRYAVSRDWQKIGISHLVKSKKAKVVK